jgi:hypothetical protein
VANETFMSLTDASSSLPTRNGKKIHWLTIRRWIVKGLKGTKLAAVKIGGVWFTKASWLDEFHRSTTQVALQDSRRHPTVKRESHRKAELNLQRRWSRK